MEDQNDGLTTYETRVSEVSISLEDGSFYHWIPPTLVTEFDAKLIAMWLHGKAHNTVIAYCKDLAKYFRQSGKSLTATKLADLMAFDIYLRSQPISASTRMRTLAALKSILTYGAKQFHEVFPVNEGMALDLPKLPDTLAERIMSESQMDDILRLETNKRNHAMLILLYYGGLRVSELCNLKWRNLQERNASGQIAVYSGKSHDTRYILLDTDTWLEVWQLRNKAGLDDYVFASRQQGSSRGKQTRRLSESRVFQIVRQAAKRAGVAINENFESNVSPHWFRHAHATHSLEAGASITLVQETLGHGSILVTKKYSHVRPTDSSAIVLRKRRKKE